MESIILEKLKLLPIWAVYIRDPECGDTELWRGNNKGDAGVTYQQAKDYLKEDFWVEEEGKFVYGECYGYIVILRERFGDSF